MIYCIICGKEYPDSTYQPNRKTHSDCCLSLFSDKQPEEGDHKGYREHWEELRRKDEERRRKRECQN